MSAVLQETTRATIPLVDIGGLYSDDPAAKAAVAAQIGRACDEIGFFYAVGHHVPVEVIEAARDHAAAFFALPLEERLKVKSDRNNRGYREMGDTVHKSGKIFARDSFDLGFPVAEDDPEVLAGTPLYAPNQWPDLPGFEAALTRYYTGTFEVGMKILEGFALYLGKEADFFSRQFSHPVADMVINHYYGYGRAVSLGAGETASGAHTDHGIVTILWQDESGGLQVLDKGDSWIDAPPIRGSYVINVGELMKRWTNGRFRATVHRVIHTKDTDRISMPLFCNPDFRTVVDPRQLGMSEAEAKYEPVMSGDFLLSRFKATRKLWGAEQKKTQAADAIEMAAE
ncbi:isopenicillin N synthase family oxygenase [Roseomonas sp. OT10]|uniref:isopenicillin N synthase family dioxygenase n=1 Tax=Roseomonas cutis TaxID=2897332 RepID=UPI001E48FD8C|nr:2-oxoglutarate and iron-dependent oxygenase domain-containing protein [Roseomonas sp. OT10]UFN47532.1 isopenicillin N synthase family oxygenase [Roseomonas sp. OT10]